MSRAGEAPRETDRAKVRRRANHDGRQVIALKSETGDICFQSVIAITVTSFDPHSHGKF